MDKELDALPADIRASFARICQLIVAVGLERMGAPHVRHLSGPVWEMRMSGRDRIARALHVAVPERRVLVVRAFSKKIRRTPRREIELALRRAKEAMT